MQVFLSGKIVVFLFLLSSFTRLTFAVDNPQGASASKLLDYLREGGHIIYMRHAKTDHSQKDRGANRLESCTMQRNLSDEGRRQAQKIGEVIVAQGIPIGDVYTSPYCRCKETAELTFSKLQVENDLQFSISKSQDESKYLGDRLKDMMLNADTTNGNAVFVGHTSNLKEGLGVWPKPEGVLVVFKKEDNKLTFKGIITPDALMSFQ
jgi:phosphohistidine phosphatase SixA